MRTRLIKCELIAVLLLVLSLCGCIGSSAPTHFYMFDPPSQTLPESVQNPVKFRSLIILSPVEIPEYLNRSQVVMFRDGVRYDVDEFHQWLEPLQFNLTRVLAENLSLQLNADGIDILTMSHTVENDFMVNVQILRLDGKLGGNSELVARWSVFTEKSGKMVLSKRAVFSEAASDGTVLAMLRSQNRLVESLGSAIARDLRLVATK